MAPKPKICSRCKGSRTQHSLAAAGGDTGCWCTACLKLPEDDRCAEWSPLIKKPAVPVDRLVVAIGHDHPDTAQVAAAAARLRSGTRRKEVFDVIQRERGHGATDDEMERLLGQSHQSVSATRNTLMTDGLIVDSGLRRPTRYANMAIVWVIAGLNPIAVNS